ncbi:hypothetical protein Musp01_17770 [Muricauda sp. NBRC 101325]|nr:hypothetical protein Musp01_17770 [Muricauda sp. NBRC 101325]
MHKTDEKGSKINPLVIPKKLMMAPRAELGWLVCSNPRFLKPIIDKTVSQSIFGLEAAFLENL